MFGLQGVAVGTTVAAGVVGAEDGVAVWGGTVSIRSEVFGDGRTVGDASHAQASKTATVASPMHVLTARSTRGAPQRR